jgi:hypothetical protein
VSIEQSPNLSLLESSHIDLPEQGPTRGTALSVAGWALGKDAKVVAVEILLGDRTLRATRVDRARPDAADAHRGSAEEVHSGFHTHIDVRQLPLEFELRVIALLGDGNRAPLGSIHALRVEIPQTDLECSSSEAARPGPTLKPELEKLISHSLSGGSAADSSWRAETGIGDGSGRDPILEQLDFEGRKVLDLGCGLGDRSRRVRARGAKLVDGFDRDPDRLRAARLLNAFHDATRVSFYDRDVSDPESYSECYDIVLALPVATAIESVMGRIAEITCRLLVTELPGSGPEESALLSSIQKVFQSHEIIASGSGRRYVIAHPETDATKLG